MAYVGVVAQQESNVVVEDRLKSLIEQCVDSPGRVRGVQGSASNWMPLAIRSARIMIAHDNHRRMLQTRLVLKKAGFSDFTTATRPDEVLPLMQSGKPSVVLLHMKLNVPTSWDVLRSMKIDPELRRLPVIVICSADETETALEAGAFDVLTASMDTASLLLKVRNGIRLHQEMTRTERECERLENVVRLRTRELMVSRQQLIGSLARAAEFRDNETGNHVLRVGRYAGIIAEALGWSVELVERIEQAAQLHDVGKIGIPDAILFKSGRLDPQEFEIMQSHALLGRTIIEPYVGSEMQILRSHAKLGSRLLRGNESPMLKMAAKIAQTHHERWDGSGYPLGLMGTDIPIEGRITAVADVFDALSSHRPYKPAYPRERCLAILEDGRGSQFDPDVLDAFQANSEKIVRTQLSLADFVSPQEGPQGT